MMTAYEAFLNSKEHAAAATTRTDVLPAWLYDFQRELTGFALARGRAAIFADCGLGKTPMQLAWADAVVRETNRSVLLLTPLAVAAQTLREAEKFGVEATRSRAGHLLSGARIVIANYEQLHRFNRAVFGGVVCDESSILKSFSGETRKALTEFLRPVPYRLLCTATAAPNDYIELGTSSEALGELGHMDMLTRFFVNDQHSSHPLRKNAQKMMAGSDWRFKGHAEMAFWRWVCTWARACRRPSDLGYDDAGFALPALIEREHVVEARRLRAGMLFSLPAVNMHEEREERRRTLDERCEMAASLVADTGAPFVVWCHLNSEGDRLQALLPEAVQVSGADSDDVKEERFVAFARGQARGIIIKPKIGAYGLNWQHCSHVVTFATHSYEQYYQAVRRCWRYGQTREVGVDIVMSEGEQRVGTNLRRKAEAADRMFTVLVSEMRRAAVVSGRTIMSHEARRPEWL